LFERGLEGDDVMDESMRHRVHGRFEELLGVDEAVAVMNALRHDGLALHDDVVGLDRGLGELRNELHEQIGLVRSELHEQIGLVRAEVAGVRTELATQVGLLRADIAGLRGEFVSRSMLFAVIGAILATATLMAAVMAR
jgi:hypothetical protein